MDLFTNNLLNYQSFSNTVAKRTYQLPLFSLIYDTASIKAPENFSFKKGFHYY